MVRTGRDPVRPVLLREADDEPRRRDARLRGKAHQAPCTLLARCRGDDEHGVVELRDEPLEPLMSTAAHLPDRTTSALTSFQARLDKPVPGIRCPSSTRGPGGTSDGTDEGR